MAKAFKNGIVFPNRFQKREEKFFRNHPIEKETYVGGYVECLNNGIYRSDIPTDFKVQSEEYENISNLV